MKADPARQQLIPSIAEIRHTLASLTPPSGSGTAELMVLPIVVDGQNAALYSNAWRAPVLRVEARQSEADGVWRWHVTETPEFHL